jgi:phosphoribosylamine--glycine ligase
MKVLLLGKGGREHAIGWKLAQSPHLDRLISLPGNPGLAPYGPLFDADPNDPIAVADAAAKERVDLVVVGPEAPLAAGVTDHLETLGIAVFGPVEAAARLETSKWFAKQVMAEAGVATGSAESFAKESEALDHLETLGGPYVVKADGLAAGKGVLVTRDLADARGWVEACFGGRFGAAGSTVVIEEYLEGDEISVFGLAGPGGVIGLRPARDYKRLLDGDRGPNTGGMGSFSPVEDFDDHWVERIVSTTIQPVLDSLAARGTPYQGFIYAGLVLTETGPKVLEFNCRLGDPETQVILPLLDDDLLQLIVASLDGSPREPLWSDRAAVNVVMAADGYPSAPRAGDLITGLDAGTDDTLVFHAGTATHGDEVVTEGGRILSVVGLGPDIRTARARAYDRVGTIDFNGRHYRKDIAR